MTTLSPLSAVPDPDITLQAPAVLANADAAAQVAPLAEGDLVAEQQGAAAPQLAQGAALAAAQLPSNLGGANASAAVSSPAVAAAAATPLDARGVASIYQLALRRPADDAGLSYWGSQLAGGLSREQYALNIFTSREFRASVISDAYQLILQREVDDRGLDYWLKQMESGKSLQYVVASILASPEFMGSVGDNEGYIVSVYFYALNRFPDELGYTYWLAGFNSTFDRATGTAAPGTDRFQVAMAILTSQEAVGKQVNDLYTSLLNRSADTAGMVYWSARLRAGIRFEEVMAGILGSGEYWAQLQMFLAQNPQTNNANIDAGRFLLNTGRLSWTWPVSLLPGIGLFPGDPVASSL